MLKNLDGLDSDSRAALDPILREKYHIPIIERITSIEGPSSGKRLDVYTAEGTAVIEINSETDVDWRDYPRVVFNDRTQRRRYVIEDADAVDKHSRDLLRRRLRSRGRGRHRHR